MNNTTSLFSPSPTSLLHYSATVYSAWILFSAAVASGASGPPGAFDTFGLCGAAPGSCFPFTPAQYRAPHLERERVPLGAGTRVTPKLPRCQPGQLGAAPAAEIAFSHLGESGYTR